MKKGVVLLLMLSCISCKVQAKDDEKERGSVHEEGFTMDFSEEVEESEEMESVVGDSSSDHDIELQFRVSFSECVYGNFRFRIADRNGAVLENWQNFPAAVEFLSPSYFFPSNYGGVQIEFYNDINTNEVWESGESGFIEQILWEEDEYEVEDSFQLSVDYCDTPFRKYTVVFLNSDVNEQDWNFFFETEIDMLILDNSVFENYPITLQELRKEHPDMYLFPYVDPISVSTNLRSSIEYAKKQTADSFHAYMSGIQNGEAVDILQFWPGSIFLNTTSAFTQNPAFLDELAQVYITFQDEVAIPSGANGGFLDNFRRTIFDILERLENGVEAFDTDVNGCMESAHELEYNGCYEVMTKDAEGYAEMDYAFQEGMSRFITSLVQGLPDNFKLVSNQCNGLYLDYVHGQLCEGAPNDYLGGWRGTVEKILLAMEKSRGHLSVWDMYGKEEESDEEKIESCRLGSMTAKIIGSYHACNWDLYHSKPLVIDEDLPEYSLGRRALGHIELKEGIWLTHFEHGVVVCNPKDSQVELQLVQELYLLPGVQVPDKNTGEAVSVITLDSMDCRQLYFKSFL